MSEETEGQETALPRETGAEKSGKQCPVCGADLPAVTTPYGSTTAGACSECSDDALEAQKAAANEGVPPKSGAGSGLEAWQEYARAQGASDEDLEGKTRDELAEAYGG